MTKLVMLRDEYGEQDGELIVFDKAIDEKELLKKYRKLVNREDSYTYDDLIHLLDSFGKYKFYYFNDITTLNY